MGIPLDWSRPIEIVHAYDAGFGPDEDVWPARLIEIIEAQDVFDHVIAVRWDERHAETIYHASAEGWVRHDGRLRVRNRY